MNNYESGFGNSEFERGIVAACYPLSAVSSTL